MDRAEVESQKWERLERVGTIALLLAAAAGLLAMGASEGIVGGCVGCATGLAMPGSGRVRAIAGAGIGALAFGTFHTWAPLVTS